MLLSLLLPIVLSGVAMFFLSFLSWAVFHFHKADWPKMPCEDEFLGSMQNLDLPPGNYMFPGVDSPAEMQSEEFQAKQKAGPVGIITVFEGMAMGKQLVLTIIYFLAVSFCWGYLATLALSPGDDFATVFRFIATAALLTLLPAIVQHSIWFHNRIVAHVIEAAIYAIAVGAIFASLWPN